MSIKVICDSTAYLPKELIDKYDICIVSLNIIVNNKSYREVDIDTTDFYQKLREDKNLPTSSQPTIDEMYKCFENIVSQGHSVVGIFMSSDMSGTFSTANLVKGMILEKYPDAIIEIIDSRSNSMQLGFAALAAAEAAHEGSSLEEVIKATNNVIQKSRYLFVPETLEYLIKGGRIGGAKALLGMIFQIRPILTVVDGKTSIFHKVRTKKKAVDKIVETLLLEVKEKGIEKLIVHNINCEEEGKELAHKLESMLGIKVQIYPIGPIIGLHVGPGAIGVVYYTKK